MDAAYVSVTTEDDIALAGIATQDFELTAGVEWEWDKLCAIIKVDMHVNFRRTTSIRPASRQIFRGLAREPGYDTGQNGRLHMVHETGSLVGTASGGQPFASRRAVTTEGCTGGSVGRLVAPEAEASR